MGKNDEFIIAIKRIESASKKIRWFAKKIDQLMPSIFFFLLIAISNAVYFLLLFSFRGAKWHL